MIKVIINIFLKRGRTTGILLLIKLLTTHNNPIYINPNRKNSITLRNLDDL